MRRFIGLADRGPLLEPALAITFLADRTGRRRLLLATILGFTLCTLATAFVQTAEQFVVLQFLARTFIDVETIPAVARKLPIR